MNSDLIFSHINEFVQLDECEKSFLESVLIPRPFKQGELIIQSGDTARYMLYVNSGYLMTYFTDKEGMDHVIQFATSSWWSGDIHSVSDQPKTIYSTRALSDGEVLLLPRLAHQQLLEKYIRFEKYFRIQFQRSVMRNQLRLIESYSSSAEERYLAFVNTFSGMEQYVPQKYIASFLGITPEFLSKVRKKLAKAKL